MANFFTELGDTAKSLGGALVAPAGAAFDIAHGVFNDTAGQLWGAKSYGFTDFLKQTAGHGQDMTDPFFSKNTLTGQAFGKTMHADDVVWSAASRRAVTVDTMLGSAAYNLDPGMIFNREDWSKAYQTAKNRSIGQAVFENNQAVFSGAEHAVGIHGQDQTFLDPMDKRAYNQIHKAAPLLTSVASGLDDMAARWYLDPLIIAGKASKVGKAAIYTRKLTDADRIDLGEKLQHAAAKRWNTIGFVYNQRDPATRTDQWLKWTEGKNASTIYAGTDHLNTNPQGKFFAAMIADADKAGPQAADAKRRIVAIAGGDYSQIQRLQAEITNMPALADQMKNMLRETTLELKTQAMVDSASTNPTLAAYFEKQLGNLDDEGAITKFITGYAAHLGELEGLKNTLDFLPGVTGKGKRAAARAEGRGLLRSGEFAGTGLAAKAGNAVISHPADWAKAAEQHAKDFADVPAVHTLYQKGLHAVPILFVKSVKALSSPYLKAPLAISDALRTQSLQGVIHYEDWESGTGQLDALLRRGGVDAGEHQRVMSKAYGARTELEKDAAVRDAENTATSALWDKHVAHLEGAAQHDEGAIEPSVINRDYLKRIMLKGAQGRKAVLAQAEGRVYAATEMPDEMIAMRSKGMLAAQDQATMGASRAKFNPIGADGIWKPRVDMLDDGTPMALLDTELRNSMPLLDIDLMDRVLSRDGALLSRLSRSWQREATELGRLSHAKTTGARDLQKVLDLKRETLDSLEHYGTLVTRGWKFGVLFRLGYPMRIVMDDQTRIMASVNYASFFGVNSREGIRNFNYNHAERHDVAKRAMVADKAERQALLDSLDGTHTEAYASRKKDINRLVREIAGHQKELDAEGTIGFDRKQELAALIAGKNGSADYLREQLGKDPAMTRRQIAAIEKKLKNGLKDYLPDKRTIGMEDVKLAGGYRADGAFATPYGAAQYEASKAGPQFDQDLRLADDRALIGLRDGSYRTYDPRIEPGTHVTAWNDVINHQFRLSPVAMHFVKDGTVPEFRRWLALPEQAQLRKRLSVWAHDPEGWGERVQAFVRDYLPTSDLRAEVAAGPMTEARLKKLFSDPSSRPIVHGSAAGYNIGTHHAAQFFSKAINRIYKWMGEMPSDALSRHPFYNTMYKTHMEDLVSAKRLAFAHAGRAFSQDDVAELQTVARSKALLDMRRTLFDMATHTQAAHTLRFIAPFFAAYQEVLSRWWRLIGDDPSLIRRFQQGFDIPSKLHIVIDQNGDPVPAGAGISSQHRILLQLPQDWGGPDPRKVQSKWSISEDSFNLVFQGGLLNPGIGPLVTVPMDYLAQTYADIPSLTAVAAVLNPYPTKSPFNSAMPATLKRLSAWAQGSTHLPGAAKAVINAVTLGTGADEYNSTMSQNVTDRLVAFRQAHGREPNRLENVGIMQMAAHQTNADLFHRVLWNFGSPSPARPGSKYAVVQNGWYKISGQARAEGKSFDWAIRQFRDKFGDVYLPLIAGNAANPAAVDATGATVGAIKTNSVLLGKIDPHLTRMVIGAEAADLAKGNPAMAQYSSAARNWLLNQQMDPTDPATYLTDKGSRAVLVQQEASAGWTQYTALTGQLTALAQQAGLTGYSDSTYLMSVKQAATQKLAQLNPVWWDDYQNRDAGKYDRYLSDMELIAKNPNLNNKVERNDVMALKAYLELRKMFVNALEKNRRAGLPYTTAAKFNQPMLKQYTQMVNHIVESVPGFETYMYSGIIEFDPLLVSN